MIWVDALQAIIDRLEDDDELSEALGGSEIYRHGEHNDYQVPGIFYLAMEPPVEENTNPFTVQLDVYARDIDQLLTIERRLRRILHRDIPQTIGDIKMWTQLTDARDHVYPTNEAVHRSFDFRFEPARETVTY